MTNNQIVEYVLKDPNIIKLLRKINNDDFKQEIFHLLLEMNNDKLNKIYNGGKIIGYVISTIYNQINSKTSPFYTKYRKNKFEPIEYDINIEENEINIMDKVDKFLDENIHWSDAIIFRIYYFGDPTTDTPPLSYRKLQKYFNDIPHLYLRKSVINTTNKVKHFILSQNE